VTLILASLGIGSAAMGSWIQNNKEVFLTLSLFLVILSFASAIHEKRKKGKNTGLIIFAIALVVTSVLLSYNKVKFGIVPKLSWILSC
jgi:NhaP-type Na+/H+ or K+/H+ antiporter